MGQKRVRAWIYSQRFQILGIWVTLASRKIHKSGWNHYITLIDIKKPNNFPITKREKCTSSTALRRLMANLPKQSTSNPYR